MMLYHDNHAQIILDQRGVTVEFPLLDYQRPRLISLMKTKRQVVNLYGFKTGLVNLRGSLLQR